MEIRMELNQRYGRGFQIRFVHGPVNEVYDKDQLNMYTAGTYANMLLETANKEAGTNYTLEQVVRVPEDALTANAATDFAAARMLQDIRNKTFSLSIPAQQDVKMMEIDGHEEAMLSARGVVLMCSSAWKLDGNGKAHDVLRRYCEYVAAHGFKGGASKALAELDSLGKGEDSAWVKNTFARYVTDQNALMEYVLGALA